nr:Crp/Fnr family transcriptional regulator [Paracoccus saliphilus]
MHLYDHPEPGPKVGVSRQRDASHADLVAAIKALQPDVLRGASDAQLGGFLSHATVRRMRRRKEILRQGEPAACGFIVIEGQVDVTFTDPDGNRVLAHLARPGEVLGEAELFSGLTCAASCTCHPGAVLLLFDAALILRHLPAELLLRNLARIFHNRMIRDNSMHSVAMFYDAAERVRVHLLSMSSADAPEVQISQNELAGFAGCSRQTVNRTLAQLRAEGIVEMGRGTIRVLDRKRLVDFRHSDGPVAAGAPLVARFRATVPPGTRQPISQMPQA